MVGPVPGTAANDDQSQLRRAMRAASAAEAVGEEDAFRFDEPSAPAIVVAAVEIEDLADADDGVSSANDTVDAIPTEALHEDELAPADETVEFVEPIASIEPVEFVEPVKVVEPAEFLEPPEPAEPMGVLESAESPAVEMVAPESIEPELVDLESDEAIGAVYAIAADDGSAQADETAEILDPAEILASAHEEPATDVVEEVAVEQLAPLANPKEDEAAAEEPAEAKPRKKRAPAKKKTAKAPRKAKAKADATDAVVESVPEDDVWVSDAVAWSLSGEWTDGAWSPTESADCPRRLEELREAAAEGRLTIWGRSSDAGTWQPIDAAYWKSGTVETASLAQGRENVVAEPKAAKAKGKARAAQKFSALKVSRAQVEELWRPDEMH